MYDQKCYDLAMAFLLECKKVRPGDNETLAQEIQDTIEDWIEENYAPEDRA